MSQTTPMMQQWHTCKEQAPDQLLLFRMGDFYEAFYEDAKLLSAVLDLTLTQRGGIAMAGIPWHAADGYIERLVAAGHKIAIAEQLEDPKKTKGLVKRGIVRVITPGTWLSKESDKVGQYIVAITQVGSLFGLALMDVTTGLFQAGELDNEADLINELYRLAPKEILTTKTFALKHPTILQDYLCTFYLPPHLFEHDKASMALQHHFAIAHLDRFGLKAMVAAINAAGALLCYVQETLHQNISHIKDLVPYAMQDILLLDRTTLRNLDLVDSLDPTNPTLLKTIDATLTAMGGRLIREWIKRPLTNIEKIHARQDVVQLLVKDPALRLSVQEKLKKIADIERLIVKISCSLATARDVKALGESLKHLDPLYQLLESASSNMLQKIKDHLGDFTTLAQLLEQALVEEPPARLAEGRIFQTGYHPKLDELDILTKNSRGWLAAYQVKLKEQTGIKNLKVSYNKIFGYTIEISKGQAHLAPSFLERRQTLANAERFVSIELKEYEQKVLTAEEQTVALEKELLNELMQKVLEQEVSILRAAKAIALLDVFQSLAQIACNYHYIKPEINTSDLIHIKQGRHPIIERRLPPGEFIPNDLTIGEGRGRMLLLTGPNMAGKSTFIRQIALLCVLAQIGSFIPASYASIGIIDKIFTRIGANDDLARGQSTFMVEMSETASILRHATSRSLVILDEIGRGTSTYDGLSIAWAVAEYLLLTEHKQAKTLFATHYGELTELSKHFPDVVNAHAAVEEQGDQITFSHQIKPGRADRSYGIHVAQLAGLPLAVVKRSSEILKKLENKKGKAHETNQSQQLLLF